MPDSKEDELYERMDALLVELQSMLVCLKTDPAHTDLGQLIELIRTTTSQLQTICDAIPDPAERSVLEVAFAHVDEAQRWIEDLMQSSGCTAH